jgi:hypothetical protein
MKLYYAYNETGQVTSSVQEDYLKIEDWKITHPDYILQEEVSRNNDILKVVDGVVVLDTEKIARLELQAQIQELKQQREEDLRNNTVDLLGYTFNTRPSDLSNFQLGIDKGETLWPDVDDYMVDVTTEDLQTILTTGIAQGEAIWNSYKAAVKAIQTV